MHTKLHISQTDRRPMYLQIMEQIKHRIAVGDWSPGTEIPSIRALAAATRVSVITVKRAFADLEREGILVTRQGKGTFVSDQVDLGGSLKEEELESHMRAAITAGKQMGLTDEELEARWREVMKTGKGEEQ